MPYKEVMSMMKAISPLFKRPLVLALLLSCFSLWLPLSMQGAKPSRFVADTLKPLIIYMDSTGLSRQRVVGQVEPWADDAFRLIDLDFASKEIYLQAEVADKFEAMCRAALEDSIRLRAISGLRTFDYQCGIWERKWAVHEGDDKEKALSILRYSAMPMTSRHHWGTDVDINSLENEYFREGKGLAEYEWLCKHAADYGFYQVYTSKDSGRTGYEEEKWHWSYMPLAEVYLDYFNKHVSLTALAGFSGALAAQELDVISLYVNGIARPKYLYIMPSWQVELLKLINQQ